MLHEILLSLSGYPSPLWEELKSGKDTLGDGSFRSYVSAAERSVLEVLAHLCELHLAIKDVTSTVSANHRSMICRAVAGEIRISHLARFRQRVLEVEQSILTKDSAHVGGYDIVPLSTVVSDFSPWTRRLEWLLRVARVMQSQEDQEKDTPFECTGAKIMDFLEKETYTGYSDIGALAVSLYTAAQAAWLRQAASWILYGQLPAMGLEDFFIQPGDSKHGHPLESASISPMFIPSFVSLDTAESILSIGSSINHIRDNAHVSCSGSSAITLDPVSKILPRHLGQLKSLTYPLSSSVLTSTVSVIRSSISQNSLSEILPLSTINRMMRVIHDYLLLNEGEFAMALIAQSDKWILSRNSMENPGRPIRRAGRVDELAVKQTEMSAILSQTWEELAASLTEADMVNEFFEHARQVLRLQVPEVEEKPSLVSTILPSASTLTIKLPPGSGLSLFLNHADLQTYSIITSYLLSIRRAEIHLSDLWKLTPLRRCHPTPLGPPLSAMRSGTSRLATQRARSDARNVRIRRYWASAGKVLFVLNEIGSYLHGEVIAKHWRALQDWVDRLSGERPSSAESAHTVLRTSQRSDVGGMNDPAVLAEAHRTCLRTMKAALFLGNDAFVDALRDLLTTCDHFVALFSRLKGAWQGLDLQEDEGVVVALTNFKKDEGEIWWEMERSGKLLEQRVTGLVDMINNLGNIDRGTGIDERINELTLDQAKGFKPFQGRTIDRLIMKLEFVAGRRQDSKRDDDACYDND